MRKMEINVVRTEMREVTVKVIRRTYLCDGCGKAEVTETENGVDTHLWASLYHPFNERIRGFDACSTVCLKAIAEHIAEDVSWTAPTAEEWAHAEVPS